MITIRQLHEKKRCGEKIVMLTAYDYPLARLIEKASLDMILVGDSGGMVALGYTNTIPVTMDEMLTMVKAVRRGAPNTFLIADMPFMSYQVSSQQAVENAGRFLKEGGADAVKLEGGRRMAATVRAVVDAGIAVQGHIGLTPQNLTQLSGFRSQGKDYDSARGLLEDARALADAGIFSLILEAVPVKLAAYLTKALPFPTIGTGAGAETDGQNLITPDILGYFDRFLPKFAKRYTDIGKEILAAIQAYKEEVSNTAFPAAEHTYPLQDDGYLNRLLEEYDWPASSDHPAS
jgi:3-methyl-2-oxobutanoate hydroxymethyltransferase